MVQRIFVYIYIYIYIYINLNYVLTIIRGLMVSILKPDPSSCTLSRSTSKKSPCLVVLSVFFVFQTLSNDVIKYLMHPRIGTLNMASHTLQIKPPQNRKVIRNIWLPSIHHTPPNMFLEFLS